MNSIRCLLNLHCNFEVKFIRRHANMVAHNLAIAAISYVGRQVFDFVPPCISSLLINEMS